MTTYIKKVMVDYYYEFQVWYNGVLVKTCETLYQANKVMMKEIGG